VEGKLSTMDMILNTLYWAGIGLVVVITTILLGFLIALIMVLIPFTRKSMEHRFKKTTDSLHNEGKEADYCVQQSNTAKDIIKIFPKSIYGFFRYEVLKEYTGKNKGNKQTNTSLTGTLPNTVKIKVSNKCKNLFHTRIIRRLKKCVNHKQTEP
jgi:hypothetical protein